MAGMRILDERVESYLHGLRPNRSPVMAEMEAVAERDGVPIVHWETGRLLAALCRALDPVVLEVGTAIGYSTLHMAEQLSDGRVVTLEVDGDRARQARDYFSRAGVSDRIELIEGDARETIEAVPGPIDLLFVDAAKEEYAGYIQQAEPKLSERALLVVDNMLMSGEVALPEDAAAREGAGSARTGGTPITRWRAEALASARALNSELLSSDRWLACVLPVGDGIALAARR
ncbi:MAG: O-methyltransferase [Thermoleophilaceae bacterium]